MNGSYKMEGIPEHIDPSGACNKKQGKEITHIGNKTG